VQVPEESFVFDSTRADFLDKDIIEVINDFLKDAHQKISGLTLKEM
jgi:hypothetical protein